jgi:pimeloyl-ACP methyl ester carboxylesterase
VTSEQAIAMPDVLDVRHGWAEVDGLELHYAEAGRGEPLVLLHGWPQHWWAWREVIPELARSYRVICPDIRGLGWSEGRPGDCSLLRLTRDLIELADALGIDRFRLVGHDWGSAIGYRACLTWRERIVRFVALGGLTPWVPSGAPPRLYLRSWHIYALGLLGPFATTRLGIPENALRTWRHAGRFSAEEEQTYLAPLRRPVSVDATRRYYRNVALHEGPYYIRHHRAMRLHVPTLHLNGAMDPLTRGVPDNCAEYADDISLEPIPGCGHFVAEERPEWLVGRLGEFFD